MKPITKSVFRKLFRMKLRLIGISLVISMAMAMFVAGFYGADVMDHSISNLLEKNKMPDIFVEFSTPAEEADVDLALSNSPDIEAYDLRLKMSGVYNHNGEVFLAVFVGIKDPNNQDINKLDVEDGKLFSSSGEAVAIAGMESQGVKKGALANFEISRTLKKATLIFEDFLFILLNTSQPLIPGIIISRRTRSTFSFSNSLRHSSPL